MGFGTGPFGAGPFGRPLLATTDEVRSSLSSSRLIDGVSKSYVVNDEGGFAAMDDVAQRVLLLLAFGMGEEPKLIDATYPETMRARIAAVLAPLVRERAIEITAIDIGDDGRSTTHKRVAFRNLLTDTLQTVEPA